MKCRAAIYVLKQSKYSCFKFGPVFRQQLSHVRGDRAQTGAVDGSLWNPISNKNLNPTR
jgi:hypothetical protein